VKPNSYVRDIKPKGFRLGGDTVTGLSDLIEDLESVELSPPVGYGSCSGITFKSLVAERSGIKVVVFLIREKREWKVLNNSL